MPITVPLYVRANGETGELTPERISDVLSDESALLWVDILDPSADDISRLDHEFALHPLFLENIGEQHRQPRFQVYHDRVVAVFYSLSTRHESITNHQITLYTGPNYVLTVRNADIPNADRMSTRFSEDAEEIGRRDSVVLLYSLLDTIVDSYQPVMEQVVTWVDELEDRIIAGETHHMQRELLDLRRTLVRTRRVVEPERSMLLSPDRHEHSAIDPSMKPYFQDVYDNVSRATDIIDDSREMLTSALESYQSAINNNLNIVVRRLTSSSIILMTMALVPAVYGMNFRHMPELRWAHGYPFALGIMLAIAVVLTISFRRARWL